MPGFEYGIKALYVGAMLALIGGVVMFNVLPKLAAQGTIDSSTVSNLQLAYVLFGIASMFAMVAAMKYWSTLYVLGYISAGFMLLGTSLVDPLELAIVSIVGIGLVAVRLGLT